MAKMNPAQKMPPIEQLKGRTLGRILMKMGVLNREKIHDCLVSRFRLSGKGCR